MFKIDWLIPSNPKYYDTIKAFENLNQIDWKQKANYNIGDTVFIYTIKPKQLIEIWTKVVKIDINYIDTIDDSMFLLDSKEFNKLKAKKYVRLELVSYNENNDLNLENLKNYGLKTAPRGPQRLEEVTVKYIKDKFIKIDKIIYPDEDIITNNHYNEGKTKTVQVNHYERNPIAREKCLKHYGYSCQVCGLNFKEKYGDFAENYIHVHHIKPISEIGEEYQVDPIKDLIPVCPNCHAMLHRKNKEGKYYSVKELRNLIPPTYKYFKK